MHKDLNPSHNEKPLTRLKLVINIQLEKTLKSNSV